MKLPKPSITVAGAVMLVLSTSALAGKEAYFVKVDNETTTETTQQKPGVKKATPAKPRSGGLPTGKRQHKPFVLTKPVDKASPVAAAKKKMAPVPTKSGDVTLKRGVIESK